MLLVAAPPRCGTSMIAGLLAAHGVPVGETKGPNNSNPKGGFENFPVKQYIKDVLKRNGYDLNPIRKQPAGFAEEPFFRDKVLQHIPEHGLFKEFRILMTWPLWRDHFPDAIYVLNERNKRDNLESMLAHPSISRRGNERDLARWIDWARDRQEQIAQECPHVWVDVDRIWAGDMTEAQHAVEECGIQFDWDTASEWIDPSLWHKREGASD